MLTVLRRCSAAAALAALSWFGPAAGGALAQGAESAGEPTVDCPLVVRQPKQKMLLVMRDAGDQLAAKEAAAAARLTYDWVAEFDLERSDYSEYHLIVVGSNDMDFWGGAKERAAPEAFRHLEGFIRNGGHLLVFNTFNGRNLHHLARFGIHPWYAHSSTFARVPGLSEILFQGAEHLVPTGDYLQQSGNVNVSTPHVVLLRRGTGSQAGQAAVVTVPVDRGRVTYTTVEPMYGKPRGDWLIQVLIRWAARGGPVTPGATNPVVFDNRPPLPPEAARQAAEDKVRATFAADFEKALRPPQHQALAQTLHAAAREETDPATKYVLQQLAARHFAEGGDAEQAFRVLEIWTAQYAVPRPTAYLEVLQIFQRGLRSSKVNEALAEEALGQIDEAVRQRDLETAQALLDVAQSGAQSARSKRLLALVAAEKKRSATIGPHWEAAAPHLERLKTDPGDAAAHLEVGKVCCLIADEWEIGLEHLAQGADAELKDVVAQDLLNPKSAADREKLGDAWQKVAAALPDDFRLGAEWRAGHWYALALAEVSGLQRAALQKKLDPLGGPGVVLRMQVLDAPAKLRLLFTPQSISAEHSDAANLPKKIQVGDYAWTPKENPTVSNLGGARIIPRDARLWSARIDKPRGKGSIHILSATSQELLLEFDHPAGQRSTYEFNLRFGAN